MRWQCGAGTAVSSVPGCTFGFTAHEQDFLLQSKCTPESTGSAKKSCVQPHSPEAYTQLSTPQTTIMKCTAAIFAATVAGAAAFAPSSFAGKQIARTATCSAGRAEHADLERYCYTCAEATAVLGEPSELCRIYEDC